MCGTLEVPSKPSRPEHIRVLPPGQMPKRGKLGTEQNRIAMIHSLTHIGTTVLIDTRNGYTNFVFYRICSY